MRLIYLVLGGFFLMCGIIGIFIPLLPTTPFLLLASWLFFRSSSKFYDWLLKHRILGIYIRHFREKRAIPLRAKLFGVLLLWMTSLYACVLMLDHWGLRVGMLLVATGVTVYLLSFKTLKQNNESEV